MVPSLTPTGRGKAEPLLYGSSHIYVRKSERFSDFKVSGKDTDNKVFVHRLKVRLLCYQVSFLYDANVVNVDVSKSHVKLYQQKAKERRRHKAG